MCPAPAPNRLIRVLPLGPAELKKRRRERMAIAFISILFIALSVVEFKLTTVSTTLPFVNSIFFFGMLNINLILLISLFWLIFRNIGKLFFERRSRILGARLKTKLVVAFLAFSITPTVILFIISSLYINSSFDKWFSLKVQNTLQASLEITRTYYRNVDNNAIHFVKHLSGQLGRFLYEPTPNEGLLSPASTRRVKTYLDSQRNLLALNSVEFYPDPIGERIVAQQAVNNDGDLPRHYPRLPVDLLDRSFSGELVSVMQHVGNGHLIRSLAPVYVDGGRNLVPGRRVLAGVISVNAYIPVSLVNKVDEIASVFEDYKDTNPLKYPIKTAYFVILVMVTLVMIFVAIWMGLYIARELTVPIERLVQGAEEVGAGNLEFAIERTGKDEISVLVDSFNKMTRDLRDNREQLTATTRDLESRRLQLEAVLANIGTGVLVVDRQGEVTTLNRAAAQLLEIPAEDALRHQYSQILGEEAGPLVEIINKAFEEKNALTQPSEVIQWNFKSRAGSIKSLAGIATPLHENDSTWGVVAVIDEITHLVKAQREKAWREVARRIAHEIKNPLTPIKLSAQRLQRQLSHYRGYEGGLLKECTDTIIKHTDELKEMVNEFSNFARFPEVSPIPNNLNEAIEEVVKLYTHSHSRIRFQFVPEAKLPIFEFDRDQMKRVMINLLDNGVAALESLGPGDALKSIQIETHYNETLQIAVINVTDTGPGMSDEVRSRVFEPYFSTKREGTGLGLAIAKRIVNDHDGFIRVHSIVGQGTQFVIEIPTGHRAERNASTLEPIPDFMLRETEGNPDLQGTT